MLGSRVFSGLGCFLTALRAYLALSPRISGQFSGRISPSRRITLSFGGPPSSEGGGVTSEMTLSGSKTYRAGASSSKRFGRYPLLPAGLGLPGITRPCPRDSQGLIGTGHRRVPFRLACPFRPLVVRSAGPFPEASDCPVEDSVLLQPGPSDDCSC